MSLPNLASSMPAFRMRILRSRDRFSVLLMCACAFSLLVSASNISALGTGTRKDTGANPARAGHGVDPVRSGCTSSIIVTNANDAGGGSLRKAVLDVCTSGLIRFSQRFEIQLASEIVVNKAFRIDGTSVSNGTAGAANALVQIRGSEGHRIFFVNSNGSLTLTRVRLSNGLMTGGDVGGAVRNLGALIVNECRFDGNRSGSTSTVGGGAIFSEVGASLIVNGSTFDGNISQRGAALFNSGDAEIYNTTFSGNITDNGAQVKEGAIQNRGTLLADHITVANNGSGGTAGGLFAFNADTTLINSLFANNNGKDCQISGGTFSSTALLRQSGNCARQFSGDPLLGTLADNGGVTQTQTLGAGSPAIGAGDFAFCLPTDQRGVERTQPGTCDLGAVEQVSIFADSFE